MEFKFIHWNLSSFIEWKFIQWNLSSFRGIYVHSMDFDFIQWILNPFSSNWYQHKIQPHENSGYLFSVYSLFQYYMINIKKKSFNIHSLGEYFHSIALQFIDLNFTSM